MTEMNDDIRSEHFREMNAYRDLPAYRDLNSYDDRVAFFASTVGRKWEINEAIFDEFLNLLPPLDWRGDSFYMSEFLFDDITHKFFRQDGRYFCEVATYPPRPELPVRGLASAPQPKS